MEIIENYTGFAVNDRNGDDSILIGKKYKDIGMYTPCLRLENGIAVALGLGGFSEESVNSPCLAKPFKVRV